MKIVQTLVVVILAALGTSAASAQNYPNKPIKIIVSTSPAGISSPTSSRASLVNTSRPRPASRT
jgi:tripartite-type tricarboxylate transporter receptor subunit TctC